MTRVVSIANAVMFVLFVSWAAFQYNDPDALLWAIIYAVAAVGCLLHFLRRFPTRVAWVYVALCSAGALYLLVRVVVAREFFFDEQGREMLGLLICGGWIGFLARNPRRSVTVRSGT